MEVLRSPPQDQGGVVEVRVAYTLSPRKGGARIACVSLFSLAPSGDSLAFNPSPVEHVESTASTERRLASVMRWNRTKSRPLVFPLSSTPLPLSICSSVEGTASIEEVWRRECVWHRITPCREGSPCLEPNGHSVGSGSLDPFVGPASNQTLSWVLIRNNHRVALHTSWPKA